MTFKLFSLAALAINALCIAYIINEASGTLSYVLLTMGFVNIGVYGGWYGKGSYD